MNVDMLLTMLSLKQIKLSANGEKIDYRSPKGAMTVDIALQIKKYKRELLALLRQQENAYLSQSLPVPVTNTNEPIKVSFAQQRLLFVNELEGQHSISNNIPWNIHLQGDLNAALLKQALNIIVHRHQSLRTVFQTQDGVNMQVIKAPGMLNIAVVDVEHHQVEDYIHVYATHSFNLSQGPLVKAAILRLSAQEHILLLTIHHTVADGKSMTLLINELKLLYCAGLYNQSPVLPALTMQYTDFATWQRQCLQSNIWDRQIAYWKTQLNDMPALLRLPYDRTRPAQQHFLGDSCFFQLSGDQRHQLNRLSQQLQVTLFMTLLSGFYGLLFRYTGQTDICIGTPVANRPLAQLSHIIGFFVNTLALRTTVTANTTLTELLEHVKSMALSAFSHQDVPFEYLVEQVNPQRSASYSPLFQVMFGLQNIARERFQLADITAELLPRKSSVAKFDITLTLTESDDGITGEFEYNTTLFDRTTIENLCEHYQRLLMQWVSCPDTKLCDITYLSPDEYNQLVVQWNNTASRYSHACCLHTLIEQQANRTPNAIAVITEDNCFSYRQINHLSNRLAHYLLSLGVKPEQRIGLCLERCADMVIGLLAIVKAGAAYVPIDPHFPKKRIQYIIEDSHITLVLTHHLIAETVLSGIDLPCCALDTLSLNDKEYASSNPNTTVNRDNLVYVLYTSGSTGAPKAVMQQHSSVVNHMEWMIETFELNPADKILQKTPLSFDAASWEWALALIVGCQLVLAKKNGHLDPDYLLDTIKQQKITVFQATPSLLSNMTGDNNLQKLASLRYLFIGGEPLPVSIFYKLKRYCTTTVLCNLYGTTETAIDSTYWIFNPLPSQQHTLIGKPVSNTSIYILDKQLNPVPIGVIGEIYIAGEGLARGYFGAAELTAQRFTPNPFGNAYGERLYKSNDLARYHSNGNIEYIQRADQQIKIRGIRIELAEIENVIATQTGIKQVAIVQHQSDSDISRCCLIAYIAIDKTITTEKIDLQQKMRELLPEYMLPAITIIMDELPLMASGKIDKQALPLPDINQMQSQSQVAPRTNTEQAIASIWAELLEIPLQHISILANFFQLGGHSLLASRVINKMRNQLQVDITLRDLFTQPTVASLASTVDTLASNNPIMIIPVDTEDQGRSCTLSFAQRRFWFIHQLSEGNDIQYTMPRAIRLNGTLSTDALTQSLQCIYNRHNTLRTRFQVINGTPMQIIDPPTEIFLPIITLSESELPGYINSNAHHMFDLATGPLLKMQLLRLSSCHHVLLINMHHVISDGWSQDIFDQELTQCYNAYIHNEPLQLAALGIQYTDFSRWQQTWLQGKVLENHNRFWQKTLNGLPAQLNIPTDHPRPATNNGSGAIAHFSISAHTSIAFKQLCSNHNCTAFSGLMAVFKILLYRLSGDRDIAVGTSVACRQRTECENLIGCFVNTLVLRDKILDENLSFELFMQQVQQTCADALQYQAMPFQHVVDLCQSQRHLDTMSLVQVFMDLQIISDHSLNLSDLSVSEIDYPPSTSKFDLSMSVVECSEQWDCTIEYRTQLFEPSTIQRYIDTFLVLLNNATQRPSTAISVLQVLRADEYKKILFDWNNTSSEPLEHRCLHHLFEEQAKRSPNAIALIDKGQVLSYQQLNKQSNQIAHCLIKRGVRPEITIGICMKQSSQLIIALLAIVKAGGVYVLINPDDSSADIKNQLSHVKIKLLLTLIDLNGLFLQWLPQHSILCLDESQHIFDKAASSNPEQNVHCNNLAYVVYTAGSSQSGKGIAVTHRCISEFSHWHRCRFEVKKRCRVNRLANTLFNTIAWEIWPYLTAGAEIHFVHSEIYTMPVQFAYWLQHKNITHCFAPAAIAEKLIQQHWEKQSHLCYLLTAGEKFNPTTLPALPFTLINNYVVTEAAVVTTCIEITTALNSVQSIGHPVDNTAIYILDTQLNPVPIGVVGELYISSHSLARGYVNHAGATAHQFIPDPFCKSAGTRMYKSNDLARYTNSGEIELIGRRNKQIHIAGLWIDPVQIETALLQHPAIEACIIAATTKTAIPNIIAETPHLTAYITIDSHYIDAKNTDCHYVDDASNIDSNPTGKNTPATVYSNDDLREFLSDKLPRYLIPSSFVILDTIPLTHHGKIDRQLLPPPFLPTTSAIKNATTNTEQRLMTIWQQVLVQTKYDFGIDDDFFALGGHSLLATTVVNRIELTMDVTLKINDFFANSTIRHLAKLIDERSIDQNTLDRLTRHAVDKGDDSREDITL